MREQKMRIGMTLMVLIVGVITVMARSVVEISQTPTADELAEMTSIRPVPGKNFTNPKIYRYPAKKSSA